LSKYILGNTKKLIFYTVIENILSYGWEVCYTGLQVKVNLSSTEMDFWRQAARISRLLEVRKEVLVIKKN
jgi:hypothetical protein